MHTMAFTHHGLESGVPKGGAVRSAEGEGPETHEPYSRGKLKGTRYAKAPPKKHAPSRSEAPRIKDYENLGGVSNEDGIEIALNDNILTDVRNISEIALNDVMGCDIEDIEAGEESIFDKKRLERMNLSKDLKNSDGIAFYSVFLLPTNTILRNKMVNKIF